MYKRLARVFVYKIGTVASVRGLEIHMNTINNQPTVRDLPVQVTLALPVATRPVSLTSVICKLLERLIKDHMVEFLVKHKLLNSSQHGFLKARSCLTNMLCYETLSGLT